MTPQERDLIVALFTRLQQQGNPPKDREAEALIADGTRQVPDAPYLLAQTVLIQDMALSEAQHRISDLERQVAAQQQPTSFLGGARGSVPSAGPWGSHPSAPPPQAAPSPVWTQPGAVAAPMAASPVSPLAAPGASSGFLRQAATTAAGIAGGALLFQGISSLFGPHYGGGMFSGMQAQPGLGETVVNNYYDNPSPDSGTSNADWNGSGNDPGITQADDPVSDQGQNQPDFGNDQSGDFSSDSGGGTDI